MRDITNAFPHKELTPIIGRPTYEAIRRMEDEMKKDALTVKTNMDGGNVGLVGIILANAKYTQLTGHGFIPPPQPPPLCCRTPNSSTSTTTHGGAQTSKAQI